MLGRIGAPHGVRGWVRVQSFAEPAENLFEHESWQLRFADGRIEPRRVVDASGSARGWQVALEGVADRDAAARLAGCLIEIRREALAPLGEHEYYREDLLGFQVVNREGECLGRVSGFIDTAANPVMIVAGEREHWLPAQPPHLLKVRMAEREIDVDWPSEL